MPYLLKDVLVIVIVNLNNTTDITCTLYLILSTKGLIIMKAFRDTVIIGNVIISKNYNICCINET